MALNDGSGINRSPNKPVQPTGLEYSLLPLFASWLQRTQAEEKRGFEQQDKQAEYAAEMARIQEQGKTVMGAQELQNKGQQDLEDRKQAIATIKARISKAELEPDLKKRAALIDNIIATSPPGIDRAAGYYFSDHRDTARNAKKQAWLNGDVDFKTPEEVMIAGREFDATDEETRQAIEAHAKKKSHTVGLGGGTSQSQAEWDKQSQGVWNNPNRGIFGKLEDYMKLPLSPQYVNRGGTMAPPTDFNQGTKDLYKNIPLIADQLKQQ